MNVLVIEPMKKPYMKEIDEGLKSLQSEVDGSIEVVYPFEDEEVGLICNEEGKLNGMPLNRALYDETGEMYDILAGKFLVVGLSGDSFCSLTPEQQEKFTKMYEKPEIFMRFGNSIKAIKVEADERADKVRMNDFMER